ncbi:MAG: RNA polymerase sigma factor [Planctomycetaceae bacterium]
MPTLNSAETTTGIEGIVAQCRRGDRAGQRELFALFHRRIYRLAARMVGERDAPDVTQDVFLRVFQKIDQFRGDSRLETWLHRITVNECLQLLRRRGTRNEQPLPTEPGNRSDRPLEQMEHRDLLEQAFEQLEPDVRSVFLLREVEGMNYREIADATQLAEGTVASRLNRARRRLREVLVELGWEP